VIRAAVIRAAVIRAAVIRAAVIRAAVIRAAMTRVAALATLALACAGSAGTGSEPAAPAAGVPEGASAPGGAAEASAAPAGPATQTATPQQLQFPEGEPFRLQQPQAGPPRPFQLPQVKPFRLDNGLQVFLVERHTLPLVSMDLNFDGGALRDTRGKDGLASICMAMLTEGTQQLDKIQYTEALADIASSIDSYASDDTAGLVLSSLSKHLDATFALFADTLLSPGFRASDFERIVKRRIEGVRQLKGSPQSVSVRVSGPVLYGGAHPFGAVATEASLAALRIEDCKQYVASALGPKGARLFVVGDLTEAQIRAYFSKGAIASWKGAPARLPVLPAPASMPARIALVHIPGAAQSVVSFLHFGPRRSAPDYFPNTLMAAVFGGGFSSRINMNLREAKGYSYGARGGFSYTKQYGVFTASASVRTDTTYQTLLEIDHDVRELSEAKRPVATEELDREKQGAILSLPAQFATSQAALGQYKRLVYFDLPLDYYNAYVDKVAQVSEAQVKAAAARQLKPGRGMFLVVGDADAKVIVRDPNGQDVPYTKDGQQLTLRQALADLARRGDVGKGTLIELDADGRPRG
jgi:predicted Zn-dependent peptidase